MKRIKSKEYWMGYQNGYLTGRNSYLFNKPTLNMNTINTIKEWTIYQEKQRILRLVRKYFADTPEARTMPAYCQFIEELKKG